LTALVTAIEEALSAFAAASIVPILLHHPH
jgi:hypothetical protein